ncbi:hypothetical protein [Methylopila sp. M107]|uniref:hypothetical protein n=1 Tax=Methylopila sp. M107 TaxID=1101190 RepID=UPI0012DD951A|nr:hypothetical protein [Methylopila sp. M107]
MQAFDVQHPQAYAFNPGPYGTPRNGGLIMELLCSEVLTNAGIPAMAAPQRQWPEWQMPGHVLLNEGRMSSLKAFGDILIPCAPTNLIISVKSQAARERLLYSANSIEAIGFGFFQEADEFWTPRRMVLYKRMGFSAIYMPSETYDELMDHIVTEGHEDFSVNVNGTPLYRPITAFSDDMLRVVGRSSALL